ncbi:hypothetical protein C4552_01620 [Candidatus Parcubacteria bacterium]|nr:MAG: hypothetical protein C4552_01620 [Candidatus Parcubacteria bacterium]
MSSSKLALFALCIGIIAAPFFADAAITSACDIVTLLNRIKEWFGILVGIIATIAILYAGLLFMTAAGSDEQITKAKSTLLWALVGIAVALLASGVVAFVQTIVGGTLPANCP